jgi:hypothetical protein
MAGKIGFEITDNNFLSTPQDVLKHLDEMRVTLRAACMWVQKKVQARIPLEEGLLPRNVVVAMKKWKGNVEIVPIKPKRKKKAIFNAWVTNIEYKKTPFLRPAFDESVEDVVTMFDMKLGEIK